MSNEEQFTPGPWHVDAGPFTNEGSFATMVMPKMGNQVASAFGWGNAELSLANARLIAAAPDLLAALQQVVHDCQIAMETWRDSDVGPATMSSDPRDLQDIAAETLDFARAAIAKALGAAADTQAAGYRPEAERK